MGAESAGVAKRPRELISPTRNPQRCDSQTVCIGVRQVVRTDGPQSHAKKKGTPTMGGLSFLPVAVTVACLLTDFAPAGMLYAPAKC